LKVARTKKHPMARRHARGLPLFCVLTSFQNRSLSHHSKKSAATLPTDPRNHTTVKSTSSIYLPTTTMTDFTITTNWEQPNNDAMDDFSAVSNEVFWQSEVNATDIDIMEVDQQINLLEDDLFHDPCVSPTGPIEELISMQLDVDDEDAPFLNFFADDDGESPVSFDGTSSLPFDERYKATLSKLQESMKRSQETRMSLKMKTDKTENYEAQNLSGVLNSIEQSTEQLQIYLQSLRSPAASA